jgi:hyperpolarization activated cyclic nucleotide-gated potassium channel 2
MEKLKIRVNSCLRKCFKNRHKGPAGSDYIISPDGYPKLMWDLLCMFLIFYEILGIPFKISFDTEISQEFDTLVDVVFACDIVLNFNTAFYENGT